VLEPIAQAFMASAVLSHYAPAEVQSAWLPRVASGEALVVLAQQERKARYRLDVCEAKAAPAQSGYAVTAIKSIVPLVTRPTPSSCPRSWTARSPSSWSNARQLA
jgi:hypothetical protein